MSFRGEDPHVLSVVLNTGASGFTAMTKMYRTAPKGATSGFDLLD